MNRHLFFLCLFVFMSVTVFTQVKSQPSINNGKKGKHEKKHLEIIRRFHSERGYIKKFIESGLMSNDIEWVVPGPREILPFAGVWKGPDGIAEFNRLLDSTMQYDKVEIKEYIVDGDEVAAIFWGEGIALSTGKPFHSEILRLYTFKDDKIIRVRNFYDTAAYVFAVMH